MPSIPLEHAQAHLAEVIARLQPGEEVEITRNDQPVAKLVAANLLPQQPVFGSAKGKIVIADDFDEPLDELREYTE